MISELSITRDLSRDATLHRGSYCSTDGEMLGGTLKAWYGEANERREPFLALLCAFDIWFSVLWLNIVLLTLVSSPGVEYLWGDSTHTHTPAFPVDSPEAAVEKPRPDASLWLKLLLGSFLSLPDSTYLEPPSLPPLLPSLISPLIPSPTPPPEMTAAVIAVESFQAT